MDVLCTADMCPVILNSTCVFYTGNTLTYTGITTNDSMQTALQKIDAKFGDATIGYVFTNGLYQPMGGTPVGLGGNLIANTSIGGNFTLTFAGNLQAAKHITTGGSASQFVKGDGTLDSTTYQTAGNYITALSGDVIASGPGVAGAVLAVVNTNPGVFGSSTLVPRITVDNKGRVTNVTTTAINVPSGILSFVGDVYGSGVTGSPTTLTLENVNSNVYTNNTFLKFKVNSKGLVTGAALITHVDIEGILGYVPVPETRTITINGITKDLQTNVIFTLPGGGTVTSVSVTAGTGISASVANPNTIPNITITNTAPDQVVTITGQSGIDVTGTYPDFTISANEAGAVTSVTASAPLASSGGQTPNITISQASASTNGYLSSTDWTTFNNKQNAIPYTPADDALVVHKAGTETITGQKTFDLSPITQVGLLLKNQSVTPYATGYSGISADNGNFSLIKDNGVHAQLDLSGLTVNREYVFPNANGTLTLLSDLAAYQPLLDGTGLVRMAGTIVTYDDTSYTPQARKLTINGTEYDLTADRSWSIDSMVYPAAGIAVSTGTAWGTSIVDNSTNWNTAYSLRLTSATAPLNITGTTISISQAGASADGFLSSTDWNTFNNKQASGNYITDLTGEATATGPGSAAVTLNNAAVTGKILTGVNITGGTVVATDTILQAFGKVQNQINGLIGGTIYQGVWNAATNTPTLTSGVGTDGHYYITNVAGNTNLDGISDWHVGDWAIFHDGVWQQVDNTDSVVSVNGFTGAVSLGTTDIPEGTNLYFTNTRARQAISLTTTDTSGPATYDNTTGVLNIPQYQGGVTSFNTRTGAITLTSLDVTNALTYTPVTEARTLTINGTEYDLTVNRTWSIDSMIYPAAGIAVSTGTAWGTSITDNSTNWNTAYTLRISSLTTTGSSGEAALSNNVLNIPNYTLSGLGGVPSTRTITINSTAYDLSADRTWDVGTVTSVAALTIETTGTDITSSVATGTTTPVITLNIPTASATNRGALSSADWTTFNNKLSPATAASTYVPYTGATANVTLGTFSLTATSLIKSGGTAAQILAADGSVITAGTGISISGGTISATGGGSTSARTEQTFTSTAGTNTFTITGGYVVGLIDVYVNGVKYPPADYTASNGTTVVIDGLVLADIVSVVTYTGNITIPSVSGSGTANSIARFVGSTTVGDSGITDNGTTVTLVSRALSGTSATFSGSVTSSDALISTDGTNTIRLQKNYFGGIDALYQSGTNAFGIYLGGGAYTAAKLYITNGGNVGIGTTSPSAKLEVNGFGTANSIMTYVTAKFYGSGTGGLNIGTDGTNPMIGPDSSATSLVFLNRVSGVYSEAMRITSGGNVGIGTTNPQSTLSVVGRASITDSSQVPLSLNNTGQRYTQLNFENNGTQRGSIYIDNTAQLFEHVAVSGFGQTFYTNGTERMRITSGGAVQIGIRGDATESTANLSLNNTNYGGFHFLDGTAYYIGQNSNFRSLRMYSGGSTGTGVNLAAGATSWGTYSDERMKTDLIAIENATEKVSQLRSMIGRYKTDEETKRRSFLIAQDVKEVLPEAISEDIQTGMLEIRYTEVIPLLVASIKELKAELDTATTRLQLLENK